MLNRPPPRRSVKYAKICLAKSWTKRGTKMTDFWVVRIRFWDRRTGTRTGFTRFWTLHCVVVARVLKLFWKLNFYRKIGWLFCFWSSRRCRLCRLLWLCIHNFQIILREYWSICLFQWRPFCLRRPDTPKGNLRELDCLWKECRLQLRDLIRRGEVFRV